MKGKVLRAGVLAFLSGAAACSGESGGDPAGAGGAAVGSSPGLGGTGAGPGETGGRASANGGSEQNGTGAAASSGGRRTGGGGNDSSVGGSELGGDGSGGASVATPGSCDSPGWEEADFADVYDVGPDFELKTPSEVPWESIGPGTLVRIHHREAPYADKWVISVAATAEAPVVVLGVPQNGELPKLTGVGASTRPELNYWSDTRGVLKIGGSSVPDLEQAEHIVVECLDISGAREGNSFVDEGGSQLEYDANASAIYVENGANVTLRNNVFHDSGNGLFVAHQSSSVLVSGNHIFDNGNVDSAYEHNSYTEAKGITFEFNRYGQLCEGCTGNNLKDRSSGLVVRYNYIEGGNRALDLVDSAEEPIVGADDYDDSFVYGNVLVELDGGNRQIVHYGGDGDEANYRTGTLYFYHNTVISERPSLTTLVRLSSEAATLDARNNVFFASPGSNFAVLEDAGTAELQGNWLPSGWLEGSPSLTGTVSAQGNQEGTDPGFVDAAGRDYSLTGSSEAREIVAPLAGATSSHPVLFQRGAEGAEPRSATTSAGAFE